jgi:hypothetical protein
MGSYGPAGIPPSMSRALGMDHPGFEHGRNVAKAARERPGEWVDFATAMTSERAASKVWHLRHKPSVAFRPVGTFEVRRERRENGDAVQVRYVGEPS